MKVSQTHVLVSFPAQVVMRIICSTHIAYIAGMQLLPNGGTPSTCAVPFLLPFKAAPKRISLVSACLKSQTCWNTPKKDRLSRPTLSSLHVEWDCAKQLLSSVTCMTPKMMVLLLVL